MKYSVITEDLIQPAVNLTLVVVFFFFGLTLAWAVTLNVISQIIAFLVSIIFVWLLFHNALTSQASASLRSSELLIYSIPTGLAGSFTVITAWIGRLFVGYFSTAAEAGIYQSASQITILFVLVLSSLNAIFSPMIADLYYRNDIDKLRELYRVSTKWGLYLVTPLFIVICFAPQELMITVFGQPYASGSDVLLILSVTQMINVGSGAVGFLLTMTGHQNRWFVISSVALILSLFLNNLLVPMLGMLGAAVVNCVTVGGLFIAGLIQVRMKLKLWPYDKRYHKGVLAAALVIGVLIFVNSWIYSYQPVIQVLILSILSYGLFGCVLLALGLDIEDRNFIQIFSSRITNRMFNTPKSH